MNPLHEVVTATLVDKYAPEYIDSLDMLKENISERESMQTTAVMALQRYADNQIIDIIDACTSTSAGPATTGLTMGKVALALYTRLFGQDIPDDGQTTGVISWSAYGEMLQLQQYSGQEYVSDRPMMRGSGSVTWLNTRWIPHSGLTDAGTYTMGAVYHKSAIGHAIGQEIKTEINWIPEKVAWLVNAYLSMGAVEIDSAGIVPMPTLDT
jgi:hypothetical protein